MGAVFGYGRVSTVEQSAENQRLEIEAAGYEIKKEFWFADEGVSGGVMAKDRPKFAKMLERIRTGESLVVTKIDRLGRDAIDIQSTVQDLQTRQISLYVVQLGKTDITSPGGKLLLQMLAAVAEMERSLIVERTQAGLARARAEGRRLGRPSKTTEQSRASILEALRKGETVSSVAKAHGISRALVFDIRKASEATAIG